LLVHNRIRIETGRFVHGFGKRGFIAPLVMWTSIIVLQAATATVTTPIRGVSVHGVLAFKGTKNRNVVVIMVGSGTVVVGIGTATSTINTEAVVKMVGGGIVIVGIGVDAVGGIVVVGVDIEL